MTERNTHSHRRHDRCTTNALHSGFRGSESDTTAVARAGRSCNDFVCQSYPATGSQIRVHFTDFPPRVCTTGPVAEILRELVIPPLRGGHGSGCQSSFEGLAVERWTNGVGACEHDRSGVAGEVKHKCCADGYIVFHMEVNAVRPRTQTPPNHSLARSTMVAVISR